MKASWEKIEKNVGVLTIEVEVEQVNEALNRAFKKVVAKVNVPGFRKGKVPRQIFESRFGVESLYQDAMDILLPEVYITAVRETGIDPIDRPEVDVESFAKNQPMKVTAKVQVKPEVELGDYKGIEVEAKEADVSTEEIDGELKRLQDRHAEFVAIDDGIAQIGDTAVIDFEGFADGEAFEGGKGESYSLNLGSNSFIPGFEEQVVGMSAGEEKDIQVTFPEEYHAEALKGKPATFKVKVHNIKRKNLPELDDEFAKDVSEFETIEEFKVDIENRLKQRKAQDIQNQMEQAVIDKVTAGAQVDIPQVMVETELDAMVSDFENRLRQQGMNLDMYYQYTNQNQEAMREQMRSNAEARVRQNLVLEAVAKAESIETTDEEFEQELQQMAARFQRDIEEIRNILSSNGRLETVRQDATMRKTIEFLLANSQKTTLQ
jgi:trigger factor